MNPGSSNRHHFGLFILAALHALSCTSTGGGSSSGVLQKEMVLVSNIPETAFRVREYKHDSEPDERWRDEGAGRRVVVTLRSDRKYEIEASVVGYSEKRVRIVEPVPRYAFRFLGADKIDDPVPLKPTIVTGDRPRITIESPVGTTVSSEYVTIVIHGAAKSGIAKVTISVNGDPVMGKDESEKTRGSEFSTDRRVKLVAGQNVIHVSMVDHKKNMSTSTLVVNREELSPESIHSGGGEPPRVGAHSPGYRKRIAAVIGIDTYRHWPRLEGAARDARRMAATLKMIGFDEVLELYDEDATRTGVLNLLGARTSEPAGKEDLVVTYFAGHGQTETLRSERKQGYIVPVDASADDVFSTAISMEALRGIAERLGSKHVYYAMDSCYSGLGFTRGISYSKKLTGYFDKITSTPVVQMITAGMEGEQAIEKGGQGIFTSALIRGLEGGADLNHDGYITAGELASFVRPEVSVDSGYRQTPMAGTIRGHGEVVLVIPPATGPAPTPRLD